MLLGERGQHPGRPGYHGSSDYTHLRMTSTELVPESRSYPKKIPYTRRASRLIWAVMSGPQHISAVSQSLKLRHTPGPIM
ncbi:hypothetical protein BDN72DRAFT_843618 [Pluteus cervinus]|uniref:Uncharacterized protein n=1 Tax=Pluteus cervinus TaxID=181527 RepID=A0ACD3AMP2_9AGAR|nr:hypothetical protein BDN72DRAFT_843618 [Pluteus cervinus]